MKGLSPRLLTVAGMVKPGTVADIGADHARLSIYLLTHGIATSAIATEIAAGPLARSCTAVKNRGLGDCVEVRRGDGLEPLNEGEVDTVIIAGMGGTVITGILTSDWEKSEKFPRFILQPMTKPDVVRLALAQRGWLLLNEQVINENDRWYVVLSYRPGNTPYSLDVLEAEAGPFILKADTEIKRDYLAHCRNNYKKIYDNLLKSSRFQNKELVRICAQKIYRLEEILNNGQS